MNRRDLLILVTILIVAAVGSRDFVGFTPLIGAQDDGFKVQVAYVLGLYDIGALFDTALSNGLVMVHAIRVLAIAPFLVLEAYFGAAGALVLLLALIVPLIRAVPDRINPFLATIPLLLPLVVSGRSVLVAVGVGYVALYLLRRGTSLWLFWLGVAFVNLSSASVLSVLLLLAFWRRPDTGANSYLPSRVMALAFLALSLYASFVEKQFGFATGASGYQSFAFDTNDSLFLAAISRATILVSLADGQYLRGAVYLAVGLYLIYKTIALSISSNSRHVQIMLLCCAPGMLLEGQGVIALFFPVLWLFLGALTPPKDKILSPESAPSGRRRPYTGT